MADSKTSFAPHCAIRALALTDFRSYEYWHGTIEGMLIAVSGPNGSGKTNLLEAISLLHGAQGLRYSASAHWPRRDGAGNWAVAVELMQADTRARLGTGADAGGRRQYRLNGAPIAAQALAALVPQLWLTPASERFFSEDKRIRRRFFDRFAMQLSSAHGVHMRAYEKLMRERLTVLRQPSADADWLESLEAGMAEHGVAMAQLRLDALDALVTALSQFDFGLFPQAEPGLVGLLEHDVRQLGIKPAQDKFCAQLAQARAQDAQAGMTCYGPHRSDFQLTHVGHNQPAALCSTGEQKALLIAVVLAQAQLLCVRLPMRPILLLDEVLAHLDKPRCAELARLLGDLGCQTWITTNDSQDFAPFKTGALPMQTLELAGDI